jgi:hypothetical protein
MLGAIAKVSAPNPPDNLLIALTAEVPVNTAFVDAEDAKKEEVNSINAGLGRDNGAIGFPGVEARLASASNQE